MEYLEIVDEENNLTGKTEERDIVHAKWLWHREIPIEEFTIDTKEVSEIKYIPFAELEKLVKEKPANYPFTAREYMPEVIEELRKNI